MTAKVLYTKKASDPTTITFPDAGPPSDRFVLTNGTATVIQGLIGYGDGSITYADGRAFPKLSGQGSTFAHQLG